MVSSERGILVNFKDPTSIENAIIKILSNPNMKKNMERNSYAFTRHMIWKNVALSYKNIFEEYIKSNKRSSQPSFLSKNKLKT